MISPKFHAGLRVLRAATRAAPWTLLAVLALDACQRHAPPATAPAIVLALPVHSYSGSGNSGIRYPVEAAARYSNTLSFRVAGKLIERNVRLGDLAHQGQILARLDPLDAEKQAASARAALDAAEHRLAFARQQLERDQAQFAQNLIAANQLEQTQDAYAAALAGREESAAQLVVARNTLQYNTLVADHDGVITSENADTGQVVAAGQAVYGLAWTGDTDVYLDAAASDMGRIAIGQNASVTFAALPGQRFAATVREVAPAADPQSRSYRVKLTLIQPVAAVRLGMTGEALLSSTAAGDQTTAGDQATAAAFTIPATAIFHRGNAPAVWVIRGNDSTLELRPVTVRSYGEHSALVTQGLRDSDSIVLAGVHTVFAGEHVTPVKPLFTGEGENDAEAAAVADARRASGGRTAGDAGAAR